MPTSRRAILTALVAIGALMPLTAFTPFMAQAVQPKAQTAEQTEVLALVFAADWCSACKVLDPKLRAAQASLEDLPVTFVTLDQTDADARRQAAASAREGGYTEVYSAHEGKTGFVLLVHAQTQEVLGRITSSDSESEIRRKVRRAVASA
ncbi:MAG: thioredoxin domain-containing protein [Bacteroidota bacterium]